MEIIEKDITKLRGQLVEMKAPFFCDDTCSAVAVAKTLFEPGPERLQLLKWLFNQITLTEENEASNGQRTLEEGGFIYLFRSKYFSQHFLCVPVYIWYRYL